VPRTQRQGLGDGIFHLTARGNRRQDIFLAEADYRMYLALLARVVRTYDWRCYGFCLMPNHVHLVVECANLALSSGMQRLQGTYAQWFNARYRLDGHLFQDRFGSRLIDDEEHWLEVLRYVVLNPVRAEFCESPQDWPWSSFSATIGTSPPPALLSVDSVLRQFSRDEILARRAYEVFVRAGHRACPGTGPGSGSAPAPAR
jgi:putative transposase